MFCGNSLVGARRQVAPRAWLGPRADPLWYERASRRVRPSQPDRQAEEVYQFLLPDPGMADYGDKVAKARYPEAFQRLKTAYFYYTGTINGIHIGEILNFEC